ncbi:MAG: tetratricopeptide repeat protein, partial [bacterium]
GAYKFIVEPRGFPKQEITVDAMVGGGHMIGGGTQSFFSKFPDGTFRFIPFDFIRQENLWFCQVKNSNHWIPINENMSLSDLQHWPPHKILGAESNFSNCQNCHGSQILVSYDSEKKNYITRFKSLAINCESCHGPSKRHIELATSDNMPEMVDIGLQSLSTLNKDQSIKICSQCHATKDMIESNYLPGKELEHYYSLKLPILAQNPYLEDGRVRAFAYQQNHLYSDCYLNGSMTCVDCHDPHSLHYRDILGKPLHGKFDNGQCLDCHASKRIAPELHAHHKPDSPGNLCTSCHMPFLQHPTLGTKLKFTRSDHTIPIPRPLFDSQIGIENACQKCHKDKSIGWLQAKTEEWYGKLKPHKDIITALLQAQQISDRKSASELLLNDAKPHPMAQFAGLSYFIKNFLQPDMPYLEPEIVEKLKKLSESEDLDLKALALMSLHLAQDQNPKVHHYLLTRLQNLGAEEITIRKRWAIAIDYLGTVYGRKGDFDRAILCHKKAIEIIPDDAIPYMNLGIAYSSKGNIEDALNAYRKASEINPYNSNALINLGNLFFQVGDYSMAVISFNRAIAIKPVNAMAHFYLARLYHVRGQKQEAIKEFQAGLKYAPNDLNARTILQKLQSE